MLEYLASWKEAAPALGVMIAALSVSVAFGAFIYTKRANRRRATLDIVMKTLLDDSARVKYHKFRDTLRKDADPENCFKITSLAAATAIGSEERKIVLDQLNVYELMALGIKRGLFDEALYKRWYHNQFMTDHEGSKELINELQAIKSSLYCESTSLYAKWLKNGHPVTSPGRFKMSWWAFSKQNEKIDAARKMETAR